MAASDDKGIRTNSPVIRSISDILSHGLKKESAGYWHIVRELSHSSTRYSLARALKHVHSPKERGEFWIYYTLTEGSLESYISVLCEDKSLLYQHYCETALLRSASASATFIILVAALSQISISPLDSITKAGLNFLFFTGEIDLDSTLSSPSQDSGIGDTGRSQEDVSFLFGTTPDISSPAPPVLRTSTETVLPSATPAVRLRKRVSWHETVADSRERPIWERRSWNCEEFGGGLPPEESGVEAVERGAPEGSEDPQTFSETSLKEIPPFQKVEKPKTEVRPVRKKWCGLPPGPGVKELSCETDLLIRSELGSVSCKARGSKVFRLMDVESEAVLCALTESEVCLVSLVKDRLNLQRIPYEQIDSIEVGPSDEEVSIGGKRFVVCSRGAEFCSHLDYALRRSHKCDVDFIRLHICSAIQEKVKGLLYCFVAVMGKEKIEDEREEQLMCYFDKMWFPATVALRSKRLILVWERGEKEWSLKDCKSCERLFYPRPHSFILRFSKGESLVLAAPDDLSVSLWMQGILSSLSQCKNTENENQGLEMVRVGLGIDAAWLFNVPKANIKASLPLTAVVSVLTASRYIILELGCHEAEEGGNDWILYFLSEEIKEMFMSSLLDIRPQLKEMVFPHSALSEDAVACEALQIALEKKHSRLQEYINSI